MPVDELKPGMMATAKTIFEGSEIEEFGVEIVDVMHNFYPKRDVIIVRLHGEKAEFAGPTAGMSGSPVYFEDKLIGALAYSFSSFPKDPIMGVTPISEMLEIFGREQQREQELAFEGNAEVMERYLDVAMGFSLHDWSAFTPNQGPASSAGTAQSLPLPLSLGGFGKTSFEMAQSQLAQWHLQAVSSGSGSATAEGIELAPGAPIAAVLLSGDFDIAATGTVTYRSGNRVLGFGHPFFDNGPIELPMAQAHILVTLANSLGSSKLSSTGKITGTLRQDRTTGVMGEIGPVPDMTSVEMSYRSENGDSTDFNFSIIQEKTLSSFVPLLLRLALINGLESARLSTGFNSLKVSGYAKLEDNTVLNLDNLYPGYQPSSSFSFLNGVLHSTGDIASRLAAVTNNPYKPVTFSDIKVDFVSLPGRKSAVLEELWVDKTEVEAGDTLEVTYTLRPYLSEPITEKQSVVIPPSINGRLLSVVVGGATALNTYERRLSPGKFHATSFDKLMSILKTSRRNDRLFIQLRLVDRGVATEKDELPGLPPSVYPVLTYRNSRDETTPIRDWVVQELEIPKPYMVEGVQAVRIRLR